MTTPFDAAAGDATPPGATSATSSDLPPGLGPAQAQVAQAQHHQPQLHQAQPNEPTAPLVLQTRQLTKHFGQTIAVDRIDLSVPAGCMFGLVGPNGAGKSTTLNMVTGLLRPTAGTAEVDGIDMWQEPLRAKALIGVLATGTRMFDRLNAEEMLTMVAQFHQVPPEQAAARSAALLRTLDLESAGRKLICDFSTGMAKKIGLAAAMIHNPKILILDEPFEAVDPVSAETIRHMLRQYVSAGGTVILSSHVMELVESLCDAVGIIASGRLLTVGWLDDIRQGMSLHERFVQLVGGSSFGTSEDMSWLGR